MQQHLWSLIGWDYWLLGLIMFCILGTISNEICLLTCCRKKSLRALDIKAVAFLVTGVPFVLKTYPYMSIRQSIAIVSNEVATALLVIYAILFVVAMVMSFLDPERDGPPKTNVAILISYVAMWVLAYIVTSIGY